MALLALSVLLLGVVSWRLRQATRHIGELKAQMADRTPPRLLGTTGRAARIVADAAVMVRDRGVSTFLLSSVDDLTRWVLEDRSGIARMAGADGTVTILFSDIESSTALNERLGDKAWVSLLARHDGIVRACVERHGGHIVKSQGDGFMVVFRDRESAVRSAMEVQKGIGAGKSRRLKRNPIKVRIGIHTGLVIAKDGDYFGRNVAMAARVAAKAEGGEILVSNAVREGLGDHLELVEVGVFELKGLDGEHTLWLVQ